MLYHENSFFLKNVFRFLNSYMVSTLQKKVLKCEKCHFVFSFDYVFKPMRD